MSWRGYMLVAFGCALLCTGSYYLGASRAPERLVAATVDNEHLVAFTGSMATVHVAGAVTEVKGPTEYRWITRPDGTKETSVRTGGESKSSSSERTEATAKAEAKVADRLKLDYRESVVKVRDDWSIGLKYGRSLDGTARYGGEVGRRIVGGLWVTGTVDVPMRAALVGLRLEW